MYQTWQQTLISAQAAGSNLTGSLAATSILAAAQKYTLPANFLLVGSVLRILLVGQLGNIVTTPGTLTLDVRFGGTIVFNGGAMQLSTTAHTTLPFWWTVLLTCRAIGSAGNLMGQGVMQSQCVSISAADPTSGHSILMTPNTTPTVGSNFDTTATQQIDIFGTFSLSNANAINPQQLIIESLN